MAEYLKKTVRIIPPTIVEGLTAKNECRQLRVAAYCRVSTKEDEQLNSYEQQKNYFTDKINSEPGWKYVGIFADKGITGTSVNKRDEFNKMIKQCKLGKIDMIMTKSISRFARNTLDCLKYTRMLKAIGVDVFFEEQGIHSIEPGAEFYITIYGSIAQSESENISANVKFGKVQSAREGKVPFKYKRFLGYRKGENDKPEIVSEEAGIVKSIYDRYLSGDSLIKIVKALESGGTLSPGGKTKWSCSTIRSILSNEKYMGDAIINKTFVSDCLTKKVKKNNGERQKFYVENNHPAIIDRSTFMRVQEELAKRAGKKKVKEIGTKTEQGKYSSKYALSELLICGECGTPYRRCTWTARGQKKIVWRCIKRLDYGKKYCHNSPTIDENLIQVCVMRAIMNMSIENADVMKTLKNHIAKGLNISCDDDTAFDIQMRITEIDNEFKAMLNAVSSESEENFDDARAERLINEKRELERRLTEIKERERHQEKVQERLDDIYVVLDGLKNRTLGYDDKLVRQVIESVIVKSKEKIKIVFIGGAEAEVSL